MYLTLGVLRHVLPLPTVARMTWRRPVSGTMTTGIAEIIALVIKLGHVSLGDRNCLQRSLMLYRELSYRGASPVLVVGFRRDSVRLEGHAWITIDDRVVADDEQFVKGFVPTCRFGEGGVQQPVD